jgi:hypothetical protein
LVATLAAASLAAAAKPLTPPQRELRDYLVSMPWLPHSSAITIGLAQTVDDALAYGDGPFWRGIQVRCGRLRGLSTRSGTPPAAIRSAHVQLMSSYRRLRSSCLEAKRQAASESAKVGKAIREGLSGDRELHRIIAPERRSIGRFQDEAVEPFLSQLAKWHVAAFAYLQDLGGLTPFPDWLDDIGRRCSDCSP